MHMEPEWGVAIASVIGILTILHLGRKTKIISLVSGDYVSREEFQKMEQRVAQLDQSLAEHRKTMERSMVDIGTSALQWRNDADKRFEHMVVMLEKMQLQLSEVREDTAFLKGRADK